MKYNIIGVKTTEYNFRDTGIAPAPDGKVEIKPQFSRVARMAKEGEKVSQVGLSLKIESTEQEPKPFNITVSIVGLFVVEDIKIQDEERRFVIDATKLLYPYLRTAVSSLMASVQIPPLYLPVISGPVFPEDRDVFAFTTASNPDDGNLN